ncbi:MAG: thioredoxin domain-containing protein [Deltaproteobacteria bacterium]|nr:thioredoxin domain-containing protein [Deltaproteobacteria bacterium]
MRTLSGILSVLLVFLFVSGREAGAQEENSNLPWKSLPRFHSLDPGRKKDLLEALKRESNYGVCKSTVYDCLLLDKPDGTAVRIANLAAFLVSRGVPPNAIKVLIERRAAFARKTEIHRFSYENAPTYGSEKAAITLTEFAEFKCPFCATVSSLLKKLVDDSHGSVRVFFKHFPIMSHPGTMLASTAAAAAQKQGKFWEMATLLFQEMDRHDENHVLDLAADLGLDMGRFKADLRDPAVTRLVRADKLEGVRAGVDATPTLFINGKHYDLRSDEALLKDILNEEAERIGIAPPYKDWVYSGSPGQ